ncbi:hypothetical protein BOX15_Mlig003436g1 [Macrostomum lignano]|uniref:PDZ domain-containing protein n=1 Tax=Macrostomum lignano TaxID=282301 RepID=A0A267FI83_9PLAT|nr:hypothetical protein BOX15_Mlig003436g1 [Macrostomum lignano]
MYFCEDHGSASEDDDDGRCTVLHFAGATTAAPAAAAEAEVADAAKPSMSTLAPLSLFQEAEATRSYSAPSSPRPSPASSSAAAAATAAAAAAASGAAGAAPGSALNRRQRNASLCSQQPQRAELLPEHQQVQHKSQQLQHRPGRTPSSASSASPPPPPYPEQQLANSPGMLPSTSNSAAAAPFVTVNGGVHDGFLLPQATAAFQEVREISLGRHNEEPYGMKVESIGEAFYITHVVRNSVAACAGLKIGDEIVRINDRRLEGLKTREVLQIIRQSDVCVKLAFKPRAVVARIREVRLKKDNGVLGLRLQKKPDGLYIDFVKAGTVAHGAGLKDGDQVLKINSHIVTDWSMEGAMALLKSLSESEPLLLLIRETLPLAHVAAARGNSHQTVVPDGSGLPKQLLLQQSQLLRRQGYAAVETHHQNGVGTGDGGCGPSDRTASCSRLGDTGDSAGSSAVIRRALGTNPCASTDDLEITQLPAEMDNQRGAASGSASSFLKSSRLTSFLKSARFSRHSQQTPRETPLSAGRDRGTS